MSARPVKAPQIHSLLAGLLALCGASAAAQAQCQYEITAVIAAPRCPPPFNNVPATIATALTEGPDPAVVGFYFPCGAGTADTAFVWRASTRLVSLPRPAGVSSMQAADISESGVIVGTYDVINVGFRAFVYQNGQYTELPPLPGGAWSGASGIAEDGTVVGFRSIGSKGDPVNPFNGFIWSEEDGFDDLGVMSGPNSAARDISDSGVVGWTGTGGNVSEAFMLTGGELILLGPIPVPGGSTSIANAANDRGVIAGSGRVEPPTGGPPIALGFAWADREFRVIDPVVQYDSSGAGDVNAVGQVTGLSIKVNSPGDRRGYVWQDGLTHDLNDLVLPGFALVIRSANAINDSGQIIARGFDLNLDDVTFLLTPVDRPIGDINIDCQVGVADLVILLEHWAQTDSPADLNGDGVVNVLDLIILLLNFGS